MSFGMESVKQSRGNGKMRIYTRTGDKGKTSIIGGRVDKDDVRVEAYGTVDELNSFVGKLVSELDGEKFADVLADLEKIQHELFDMGADLANVSKARESKLAEDAVGYLEERIDAMSGETPALQKFILPGGAPASASAHICRTVARRAERQVVKLMKADPDVPGVCLQYLNRLSDYFFELARVINFRLNVKDVEYVRSRAVYRGGKRKGDQE